MATWLVFMFVAALTRQYMASKSSPRRRIEPDPPDPSTLLPVYASLASAPENTAIKLVGVVRAGPMAFTSALTAEPCVACLVGATVWHSKKVPQVVANLRDATAAPFLLVLPDGELEISDVEKVDCPTRKVRRHAERERAVLARHKLERHAESTDFTEGLILDGDRITVVGTLVRESEGEQVYRDRVQRLRFAGTAEQPVELVKTKK